VAATEEAEASTVVVADFTVAEVLAAAAASEAVAMAADIAEDMAGFAAATVIVADMAAGAADTGGAEDIGVTRAGDMEGVGALDWA
jgi:hypothetical protein